MVGLDGSFGQGGAGACDDDTSGFCGGGGGGGYYGGGGGGAVQGGAGGSCYADETLASSIAVSLNDARVAPSVTLTPVVPPLTAAGDPVLAGVAQVGGTLTAIPGAYDASPEGYHFAWSADGESVGIDSFVYHPTSADLGKSIVVQVTATRSGYDDAVTVSEPTSAVVDGGYVAAWGNDQWGQIDVPRALDGQTVVAIAAGEAHSVALTADGRVIAWGDVEGGRAAVPAELDDQTVVAIAAGQYHSLALTTDGQVIAWGDNDQGQTDVPASLDGQTVVAIAAGKYFSLALTADGQVIAWGDNDQGQATVPAELDDQTVVAIAAGGYHALVVTADGHGTGWGYDNQGQATVPSDLDDQTVVAVAAGPYFSVALSVDGHVTAWGADPQGQATVPSDLDEQTVVAIDTSFQHVLAITADRRVVGWGGTTYHQLPVPAELEDRAATAVAAGVGHSLVLLQLEAFATGPDPTVTGTAEVGQTLTAHAGSTVPDADTVTYQWRRDGNDIDGATDATYTATIDDLGASLGVRVTASADGYHDAAATSATVGPVLGVFASGPAPSITGATEVGQTLTAHPGTTNPDASSFSYQWLRGTDPIDGATDPTYTLVAGDLDATVRVRVTASADDYVDASGMSDPTATVARGTFASAASPSITGSAEVGRTLTAHPGSTSPPADGLAYQWLRDDIPIDGATDPTYTLVAGDLDAGISVQVTASAPGYHDAAATSDPAGPVGEGDFASGPDPSISGTAKVGHTLTAHPGTTDPDTDAFSYQWLRGGNEIDGATESTYDLVALDLDKRLSVTVTATVPGYTDSDATSATTDPVAAGDITLAGTATITGTATVGQTLTLTSTITADPTAVLSGHWLRDGEAIGGATSTSYTLTADDYDTEITYRTTASRVGYTDAADTSDPAGPIAEGDFDTGPDPSITGTAKVGETLTAHPGTTSPTADVLAYQWRRDGHEIDGATGSSYTLVPTDLDADITVQVTASTTAYHDAAATSDPAGPIAEGDFDTGPDPSITGTAKVGETLTAHPGTTSPTADVLAYQWRRDGHEIDGATGSSYTLVPTDLDADITVQVTASTTAYHDAAATSDPAGPIAEGDFDTGPDPSITGTAKVGETLTASTGVTDPSGATLTYQWLRDGDPIDAATTDAYRLIAADLYTEVSVTVTAALPGYHDSVTTSDSVGPVGLGAPIPAGPVQITGTPAVGETLTAVTLTGDLAATGQWYRDQQPVDGAFGSRYTLTADDLGSEIGFRIVSAPAGHLPATTRAGRVGPVAPGSFDPGPTPSVTGSAVIGETLTAHPGPISPDPDQVDYQWYADNSPIEDATAASFDVTRDQLGAAITVMVTATRAGYDEAHAVSEPFGPITAGHAPRLTLRASDRRIRRGHSTTLTWTSDDALNVTASGAWPSGETEGLPATGSLTVHPTRIGVLTYRIEATNRVGTTAVEVTVRVRREPLHLDVRAPHARHRGGHLRVRTTGLDPREPYVIRLGSSVVARGRATAHGRVAKRIGVPVHAHLGRTPIIVRGTPHDRAGHAVLRVRRSRR